MKNVQDGYYWVRVPEMDEYEGLVPAEVVNDKVWVLGFDQPYEVSEISEWGPHCK